MGELKILAQGSSTQMQAQARGKLFENLMAQVLRNKGYTIDFPANSRYTGMEIDIEGKQEIVGVPVYVECKCYEKEINCSELMKFYGKYTAKWFVDRRSQGIFIVLPGLNVEAKTFYREDIKKNPEIAFALFEKDDVLEIIFSSHLAVKPAIISDRIPVELGAAGDWVLLYTDKGLFWIQYIIPAGAGIANSIAIFNAQGVEIVDSSTIDYLTQLYPELGSFTIINIKSSQPSKEPPLQDSDEVVEVIGSSSCFEYQFPASPTYFVGRQPILGSVDDFIQDVLNKKTSCRGLLFQGNSGWGKSSSVLECTSRLQKDGHFAIAIDSRSATSSRFILSVVDYVLRKFNGFEGKLSQASCYLPIGGFEDATRSLIEVGKSLEQHNSLLIIFLDQFESIFFNPEVFKRIRNLFLKVCDARTNVILGFSWKNDLIGSMTDLLPYQLQADIVGASQRLDLEPFSDIEMAAFLDNFSHALDIQLNNDLKFFLADFAEGYPWLLRKLCSHVKVQLDNGISLQEIARSALNVESLLKEDLGGLSTREEDTLRRIAKVAPIGVRELDDDFSSEIIQALTGKRLLKRIGSKYDISWDILRDYLNSNTLPIRKNYVLFAKSASILRALHILFEAKGEINLSDFKKQMHLADPTFYQVIKSMELLELAKGDKGIINLQIGPCEDKEDFDKRLQLHLQKELPNNRLVSRLLKTLDTENLLTVDRIIELLAEWSPYMSLAKFTWREYARTFVKLMEVAHLATYDRKGQALTKYKADVIIAENSVPRARHRVGIKMPWAQYATIERVMEKLQEAITSKETFDLKLVDLKPNTYVKVLTTLEDLEFIVRKNRDIELSSKGLAFVSMSQKRAMLFSEAHLLR